MSKSLVTETPAAPAELALQHFQARLSFETDCWDVHHAIANDKKDFVLIDVRSPELYAAGHVPTAINIPVGKLIGSALAQFPPTSLFIVYCAGPHCNGANKAAVRLARLGRPVKEMIGGVTGWLDEGFELVRADAPEHGER
jgi:rhodanese-related sulfurtransferase